MSLRKLCSRSLFVVVTTLLCPIAPAEVTLTDDRNGTVKVEVDGQLFTEYHYTGARRPYLYPLIGPSGDGMTRNFPLKEVPGEEKDHPHHKGLWYGHRHVNHIGFWEDSTKGTNRIGKILHDRFLELRNGAHDATLRARNRWVADDGEFILSEERELVFYGGKEERMLDFNITFAAPADKDVVFGDDKDGAMAIRVPESMRVERPKQKGQKKAELGDGHLVTSTGKRDLEAWGARAEWVDYYGPVNGKTLGIAIFDHPRNPRHPTWWHARSYGLFAANPFGQAQFEKLSDKTAGAFTLKAGTSVSFRYRFYFHTGNEKQAQVADRYKQYVWQNTPKNPATKNPSQKSAVSPK